MVPVSEEGASVVDGRVALWSSVGGVVQECVLSATAVIYVTSICTSRRGLAPSSIVELLQSYT